MDNELSIRIACPAFIKTGGVELLHQLCNYLNKYPDIDAKIWYFNQFTHSSNTPKIYIDRYCNPSISGKIKKDDILIFPEIYADLVNNVAYKDNIKAIYWESVDNYLSRSYDYDMLGFMTNKKVLHFPDNTIHMVQSYYAEEFLKQYLSADNKRNIIPLTDYISDEFLNKSDDEINFNRRLKQVVYNPSKGMDFTQLIIDKLPDIKFVPIKDMSTKEVKECMSKRRLYIDFGNHPGKDRIPREAAINGCCILTSTEGSAGNMIDIPISNKYKIPRYDYNLDNICREIKYILENYKTLIEDFTKYRSIIRKEKEMFEINMDSLVDELWLQKFEKDKE